MRNGKWSFDGLGFLLYKLGVHPNRMRDSGLMIRAEKLGKKPSFIAPDVLFPWLRDATAPVTGYKVRYPIYQALWRAGDGLDIGGMSDRRARILLVMKHLPKQMQPAPPCFNRPVKYLRKPARAFMRSMQRSAALAGCVYQKDGQVHIVKAADPVIVRCTHFRETDAEIERVTGATLQCPGCADEVALVPFERQRAHEPVQPPGPMQMAAGEGCKPVQHIPKYAARPRIASSAPRTKMTVPKFKKRRR